MSFDPEQLVEKRRVIERLSDQKQTEILREMQLVTDDEPWAIAFEGKTNTVVLALNRPLKPDEKPDQYLLLIESVVGGIHPIRSATCKVYERAQGRFVAYWVPLA